LWKLTLPVRLYLIGACILVAGLGAAAYIYANAVDDGGDADGYEIEGGRIYAANPLDSKSYVHDLELHGGKGAVLAVQFTQWFDGLWHGRQLASTLASLSMAFALACFLVANHLSNRASDNRADHRDG
jgi:hypothetical protein